MKKLINEVSCELFKALSVQLRLLQSTFSIKRTDRSGSKTDRLLTDFYQCINSDFSCDLLYFNSSKLTMLLVYSTQIFGSV